MSISPVSGLQAAKIIVSPTPGAGNYTSITAACAAASSGQTILVKDGTYTENFSVPDGVNIAAFESVSANVVIKGKISFSTAAVVSISGLQIRTNSDYFLSLSGTGVISVNFKNCNIVCFDNTGIDFTNSNADSSIAFYNCVGDISVTSIAFYSMTSVGSLSFVGSIINNSGLTTTPSNNSAGAVGVYNSNLAFPLSVSGSATCNGVNSYLDADSNVTALSLTGTCTAEWLNSSIATGTEVPVTVGTGCTALLSNCSVFSSNTVAVSGLGTLYYAGLVFNSSATSPLTVTTQIVLPYAPASSGGITTFDIDSGGPITGVGGVVTFNGIGGNYTGTTGTGEMFADNKYWLSPYVVDPSTTPGKIGSYTTIQAAINAAGAAGGGQVVVRGGTFTEDLTFLPNVNLQGMNTDGLLAVNGGYGVIVIGNHGVNDTTGDVIFTVSNIGFQTSAGITFNLASTAHEILSEFLFCSIQNSDAAGVCFALSSAGSTVACIANNTITYADNTIATVGTSCQYQHANTAISQAGAPAFVNNGGTLEVKNCYIGAGIILEVLGGNSILFNNQLFASNTGVLFSSAGGVVSNNNAWSSSAVSGYYIDGAAGSYQYNNDAVIGTATQINPAITQQTQVWRPRATAGTSSTAYAGTASFNSSDFTVVDGFVSSSGAGTDALITIYVVDNTNPAPYTTIQSAINAANAAGGGVVAIRPSATPYTENLSLLSQVMLIAVGQDGFFAANGAFGVSVIGNHTLNDTVGITFVQCTGIAFSSSTGVPFTMTAASTVAALELTSCAITTTGGFDGIVTSSTGGGCVVEAYALSANSSANILNLGANTEAYISNSKSLRTTNGSNAFTIAGNLNIYDCIIDVNSTCFNMMVGGGCNAIGNQIIANQQGVNFTSGGVFTSFNNVWDCDGAGEYIGGAGGTYTYANDIVTGNATFISIGLTVEPQIWKPFATAVSTSMGANPGTSYFDSAAFTVDQTGYVRLVGGTAATKFGVDAFTGPGTNPVLPDATGLVTITGGTAPQGTVANVVQTDSLAANQYAIQVQIADAVAASDITQNGVSHFDSASFTVDANGFVQLASSGTYISLTPYIVGQVGDTHAGFTTIQSAITQAVTDGASFSNPKTVYIKNGTYIENISYADGVYLFAFDLRGSEIETPEKSSVYIVGNGALTTSTNSFLSFTGITFNTISGDALTLTTGSTNSINVTFKNCYSSSIFGFLTNCSVGNASSTVSIQINDCTFFSSIITSSGAGACSVDDRGSVSYFIGTGNIFASSGANSWQVANCSYKSFTIINSSSTAFSFSANDSVIYSSATGNFFEITSSGGFGAIFKSCDIGAIGEGALFNSTGTGVANYRLLECSIGVQSIQNSSVPNGINAACSSYVTYENGPTWKGPGITGYFGSEAYLSQSVVHTTSTSATTIILLTPGAGTALTIKGQVTGSNAGHTDITGADFFVTCDGTAATIVGTPVINVNATSTGNVTASFSVGQLHINVTAPSSAAYNWVSSYQVQPLISNT
jgi:hypothetical protein